MLSCSPVNRVNVVELVRSGYSEMLQAQRQLVDFRNKGGIDDTIIFTEHNPVYTAGIHTPAEESGPPGHDWIRVERGGEWTYHGPGQLVIYFILNLKELGINVRDLIIKAGKSVELLLAGYGIHSELKLGKETGTWVEERKICSYGFAIREFSTFHGMAINIGTDLRMFKLIRPCGFDPEVMTSVKRETGLDISLQDAAVTAEDYIIGQLGYASRKRISMESLMETLETQ